MSTAFAPAPSATENALLAMQALDRGEPVITVDDLGGGGCEMIVLASAARVAVVAAMISEGSGFVCVTVDHVRAVRLGLPPMTWESPTPTYGGRMCVSIDAAAGTTTGISARDRTTTLRTLADADSGPDAFTRPGHVIPVLADVAATDRAGLIARTGHRAGHDTPVAYVSLVSRRDPRRIADADEAADWGLPMLRYSELGYSDLTHAL
ncbi:MULTISPECIES: 3,4-dihydroxy-2-butanone-4-phosphate synthase [unclassified Gordonia (in: high G+C Gram-positive bacteria)]|uniref:3,4-dihydroxy-2-butanone-4-phosphate synthase n=1 Tax=unclassified Gordonia (in: high G+C Gram-positive bacteria) TaxID=2657482 RepID=UPI001F0E113F|nr:3,4-dihydroxy-2-butanone-4-phosphate synthase [Gordonia sp. ABSL49_1]MCH5645008.1 3,4-dihydroxy-2-butanone-4-phosphate synthase [Gordonia sp. ABSL49_1]